MNGKYPKHPETFRNAKKFIENFAVKVIKFSRGGGSQRFGTFPKFEGFPYDKFVEKATSAVQTCYIIKCE